MGWSFGTELALMHGHDPAVEGAILLSPPLHRATDADLDAWDVFGRPLVALVPEHDDYLRPAAARERFARVHQAEVIGVDGAKHLWVGEQAVRRVRMGPEVRQYCVDLVAATDNGRFDVTPPFPYSTVVTLPAATAGATKLTLTVRLDLLVETAPKSDSYYRSTALDTLTLPLLTNGASR